MGQIIGKALRHEEVPGAVKTIVDTYRDLRTTKDEKFIEAVERLGVDDPVGAFSVHGLAGFWGLLATGLLATTSPVNGAEESAGLLYGGGAGLFLAQLIGGVVIGVFVFVTAGAMFFGLKAAGLLRVSAEEEQAGLDISEHGGPGYGPDLMPTPASV